MRADAVTCQVSGNNLKSEVRCAAVHSLTRPQPPTAAPDSLMSILPTEAHRPNSSSSESTPYQNPSSNHGDPLLFGSLHLSDSHPPPPLPRQIPVPSASAAQDSNGSSEEVNGLGRPEGKGSSPHNGQGKYSQSRRKMPGTPGSPGNQHGIGNQGRTPHPFGRKAQTTSGNHLLNFQYDPISRSRPQIWAPPPRRQYKMKPYNKDLFLQANYKFVVLDTGDYTPESMDPDKMLKWEDIICLKYSTPFPVRCPICLGHPLCPQITSCGHIFCFPCILQYLLMDERTDAGNIYKRCPLCFVMVSPKDLYTIYIENVKRYSVGDTIEFMLLARQKDSYALSRKDKLEEAGGDEIYDPFSKFIFTSDVDLSVREAISDLDSWLVRADSGLVDDLEKLPYVCDAMEQLKQRKKYWNEHQACNHNGSSRNIVKTVYQSSLASMSSCSVGHKTNGVDRKKLTTDSSSKNKLHANKLGEKAGLDQSVNVNELLEVQDCKLSASSVEKKNSQSSLNGSGNTKDENFYNFYQVVDGQHIILHPSNLKCLLNHYGSYSSLPHRVSGKILELEAVTQTEAVRRRYRYLSHFSLTTTFQLCEIDLHGVLPSDALLPFMDEIKKREKRRKQLAKKEKKEKIKAEVAEAAAAVQFSSSLGNSYHVDSPSFSMDDFEALGNSPAISSSPPVSGERQLFSNVTKLGFAAGHDSPSLKIDGTNADLNLGVGVGVANGSAGLSGSGNTGSSFANVISRGKPDDNLEAPKANESGRKGKKPSRVLMSTGGGRRY